MLYVTVDTDDADPYGYRWRIYDYENSSRPVQEAEFAYSTRTAAIEAGWAIVAKLEVDQNSGAVNRSRTAE